LTIPGARSGREPAFTAFTPAHRGGSGSPLVLLHGFADTWRTWELVLPALERSHDVLALTLLGHAGGPPLQDEFAGEQLVDAVEHAMDDAGFATAHIAGNSLGGYVALRLAARGRARSVVAFAPAGGWASDDEHYTELLRMQARMHEQAKASAPHAHTLVSSDDGRRRASQLVSERYEHIPAELLAHLLVGIAGCHGAHTMVDYAIREGYSLDAERITCPVRIVWGTADRIVDWPRAAVRYREEWLPHADWVVLDDVGHAPQLDVPLEAAQLILGFTGG
jgi:pimeloyl-ACP methyl ester carboxylesterase